MEKTVFYLKTCGTNKKIMAELNLEDWTHREIKSQAISETELETMHQLAGSYDALFSKRSQEIKKRAIDVKNLSEEDKKQLILSHYSFLKRPVFVDGNMIFIGSDKKTVEAVSSRL